MPDKFLGLDSMGQDIYESDLLENEPKMVPFRNWNEVVEIPEYEKQVWMVECESCDMLSASHLCDHQKHPVGWKGCICVCECTNKAVIRRDWLCKVCDESPEMKVTKIGNTASYGYVHYPKMREYNKLMKERRAK